MTSQSPRIYIYKITFEEVPYYYYGVHKEKKYNEKYFGTPVTHKWVWNFYTPKKQILQFFDFTDEGWLEAQEVETRLIKPFFNTDKWCLNESCGGKFSLELSRKNGRIVGKLWGKKGGKTSGKIAYELKTGIHAFTPEQRSEVGRKSGYKTKQLGVGIHGRTKEQMSEHGKRGVIAKRKLKVGIHGLTSEQLSENAKKTNSQKWMCEETGFITNAGALTHYQKKRGIDTSKRRRIS